MLTMDRGFIGLVDEANILEWEVIIMGYVILATLQVESLLTGGLVLPIRSSEYSVQIC